MKLILVCCSFGPHWLSIYGQKQFRMSFLGLQWEWVNDDRSLISSVNKALGCILAVYSLCHCVVYILGVLQIWTSISIYPKRIYSPCSPVLNALPFWVFPWAVITDENQWSHFIKSFYSVKHFLQIFLTLFVFAFSLFYWLDPLYLFIFSIYSTLVQVP